MNQTEEPKRKELKMNNQDKKKKDKKWESNLGLYLDRVLFYH
jgi:hypothetical protein